MARPCFGYAEGLSSRQWLEIMVRAAVENSGRAYSDADFARFYRRVYQSFGSPDGYVVLPDAEPFLAFCADAGLLCGLTTNTPARVVDTSVPMMFGLSTPLRFFACAHEVCHGVFSCCADVYCSLITVIFARKG